MASLHDKLKLFKTANGETVDIGDVVVSRSGLNAQVILGIELNNKTGPEDIYNMHIVTKSCDSNSRYTTTLSSLNNYMKVHNGKITLTIDKNGDTRN